MISNENRSISYIFYVVTILLVFSNKNGAMQEKSSDHVKQRSRQYVDEILLKSDQSSSLDDDQMTKIVLDDLEKIYMNKIRPLEHLTKFVDMKKDMITVEDIHSKPIILVVGPWSSGKTTLINYLLGLDEEVPHLHIGPEPTTTDFIILTHGTKVRAINGMIMASDSAQPFGLAEQFGPRFLERLFKIELPSPLLLNVTIVDTPGLLEHRRQQDRGYSFNDVMRWLVQKADVILIIFDPTKLDIGTELEALFGRLKGKESMVRIILNKADTVTEHELMRVYGALLWALSPLINVTEPPRVYVGSFWTQKPYPNDELGKLMLQEEKSLLNDLRESITKKVMIKIARMRLQAVNIRQHALIMNNYLSLYEKFRRESGTKSHANLIESLLLKPETYGVFQDILLHQSTSSFDIEEATEEYANFFRLNPMQDQKLNTVNELEKIEEAINRDIPTLMQKLNNIFDHDVNGKFPNNEHMPSMEENGQDIDKNQAERTMGSFGERFESYFPSHGLGHGYEEFVHETLSASSDHSDEKEHTKFSATKKGSRTISKKEHKEPNFKGDDNTKEIRQPILPSSDEPVQQLHSYKNFEKKRISAKSSKFANAAANKEQAIPNEKEVVKKYKIFRKGCYDSVKKSGKSPKSESKDQKEQHTEKNVKCRPYRKSCTPILEYVPLPQVSSQVQDETPKCIIYRKSCKMMDEADNSQASGDEKKVASTSLVKEKNRNKWKDGGDEVLKKVVKPSPATKADKDAKNKQSQQRNEKVLSNVKEDTSKHKDFSEKKQHNVPKCPPYRKQCSDTVFSEKTTTTTVKKPLNEVASCPIYRKFCPTISSSEAIRTGIRKQDLKPEQPKKVIAHVGTDQKVRFGTSKCPIYRKFCPTISSSEAIRPGIRKQDLKPEQPKKLIAHVGTDQKVRFGTSKCPIYRKTCEESTSDKVNMKDMKLKEPICLPYRKSCLKKEKIFDDDHKKTNLGPTKIQLEKKDLDRSREQVTENFQSPTTDGKSSIGTKCKLIYRKQCKSEETVKTKVTLASYEPVDLDKCPIYRKSCSHTKIEPVKMKSKESNQKQADLKDKAKVRAKKQSYGADKESTKKNIQEIKKNNVKETLEVKPEKLLKEVKHKSQVKSWPTEESQKSNGKASTRKSHAKYTKGKIKPINNVDAVYITPTRLKDADDESTEKDVIEDEEELTVLRKSYADSDNDIDKKYAAKLRETIANSIKDNDKVNPEKTTAAQHGKKCTLYRKSCDIIASALEGQSFSEDYTISMTFFEKLSTILNGLWSNVQLGSKKEVRKCPIYRKFCSSSSTTTKSSSEEFTVTDDEKKAVKKTVKKSDVKQQKEAVAPNDRKEQVVLEKNYPSESQKCLNYRKSCKSRPELIVKNNEDYTISQQLELGPKTMQQQRKPPEYVSVNAAAGKCPRYRKSCISSYDKTHESKIAGTENESSKEGPLPPTITYDPKCLIYRKSCDKHSTNEKWSANNQVPQQRLKSAEDDDFIYVLDKQTGKSKKYCKKKFVNDGNKHKTAKSNKEHGIKRDLEQSLFSQFLSYLCS